jgi:hypothetical protein
MIKFKFASIIPDSYKPADPPLEDKFDNSEEASPAAWRRDLINIEQLVSPEECPAQYLPELAALLDIQIAPTEDELVLRRKIARGKFIAKRRYTFRQHIKQLIDEITGLDSQVVDNSAVFSLNDWVLFNNTNYNATNLAILGGDTGYEDGIALVSGDGTSSGPNDPGFVFIDLGGDAVNPDAATRQEIIDQIKIDHRRS